MTSIFQKGNAVEEVASHRNKLAVIAVVALALALASLGAWRWWTHTPRYALRQIAAAYASHDLAKFDEYVDREHLAGSFVDQMMQTFFEKDKDEDQSGSWAKGIVQGMAMMMRPQLVKGFNDAIARGVESGNFSGDEKGAAKLSDLQPYFGKANENESGFRGLTSIKTEGKVAVAKFEIFNKDFGKSAFVDVKLRNVGDHWQVIELSNFAEFMTTLNRYEKEALAKLNAPIVAKLNEKLRLDGTSVTTHTDQWGISKSVAIQTRFTNRTDV